MIVSLTACNLEKARPNKNQYLIIASDCLESKDANLFKNFYKLEGIKVRIIHLSADSIKYRLRSEGINCDVDAVILSSIYDMNILDNDHLLQSIPFENFPKTPETKHISTTKTWVGIGINPYVLITKDDTLHKIRTYRNLLKGNSWCTDLKTNAEWFPFYSFIVKKVELKSKFNAKNWITQFESNKQNQKSVSDSLGPCKVYLTTFSNYKKKQVAKNSIYKKGKLVFPNQHIGGSYYNMLCFGIVKQAPNFTNGMKFFQYILLRTANDRLNNALDMFPINSDESSIYSYQQNLRFKKYHTSPVKLVLNYDKLKNILSTLR
jgi:ABC-type Fe3+ transport system substrate-binding protein